MNEIKIADDAAFIKESEEKFEELINIGKVLEHLANFVTHKRTLPLPPENTVESIRDYSQQTHQRNLQLLATEINKTKHDLSPKFMGEVFVEKNISYSLKGNNHLSVPILRINAYVMNAISYTGQKLWQSLP